MDHFQNLPNFRYHCHLLPDLALCPRLPEERVAATQVHVAWYDTRTLGNIWKDFISPCLSTMISQEQKMQKKQEQMKMARGTRSMNM